MAEEVSAGGVVYARERGQPRILLILDIYGHWSLPKGHVEPGETLQQAALREIEEEVGLKGTIERELGETHYQFSRNSQIVDKSVYYYLVRASGIDNLRVAPGEVQDAKWLTPQRALELSGYANNRPVLEKAISLLSNQARS